MTTADQRQLAAIVFTDIVGYTKAMEQDEQVAMNLLKRQREIIYPLVNEIGGKVLKEIGDGMLIKFGSVIQAVHCAVVIQKQVEVEKTFSLRIGVHIGDIIIENDDVFGSGVNIASRIQPLASPGGICMTRDAWYQIKNQKEFSATSLGTKALKGVQEKVEVFELNFGDVGSQQRNRMPFLKDIIQRRVPQIIGLYAISAFVVVKIVEMLVDRLVLSPHITGFCMAALLSLIPSVLIVAYFHGRSASKWSKAEAFGVPVNMMASAVFLFTNFYSTDLGAATNTIILEDEEGHKIERVIPKSEFRRNIILFFYDNKTEDSTLNWLQYGIPQGISLDLTQDLFINSKGEEDYYEKVKEAGYQSGTNIPLTLQKKIADEAHVKNFVAGSFTKQADKFLVKSSLYESKTGKLVTQNTVEGTDLFNIMDQISIKLRYDLGIPSGHIEKTTDLPVSEILTNSVSAYKNFTLGFVAWQLRHDFPSAVQLLEQSVKEDSTFTFSQILLQAMYTMSNQGEKRGKVFQSIMQHLYKLPERVQYFAKMGYYDFKQDPEKEFAIAQTMVKLSPEDIMGHQVLSMLYQFKNQRNEAIDEYKLILEIDSSQYACLQYIGMLYKSMGKNEEALGYYKQYMDRFPEDFNSFIPVAELYKMDGAFDKAKSFYQKALLVKPEDVTVLSSLAEIEAALGNFEKANAQYESTLALCKKPEDRATVYAGMQGLFEQKGQIAKALMVMQQKDVETQKYAPPIRVLLSTFREFGLYIDAEKKEIAFQKMKAIEASLKTPFDLFAPVGYLNIHLALEDADSANKYIGGVEKLIQTFKLEILRPMVLKAQGKIYELQGKNQEAIASYQKALDINPNDVQINTDMAKCYRTLKDYKNAEESLQKTLKVFPYAPKAHYELALVYFDKGDKQKALEHLKTALDIWKDADQEYKPAKKAKEKVFLVACRMFCAYSSSYDISSRERNRNKQCADDSYCMCFISGVLGSNICC